MPGVKAYMTVYAPRKYLEAHSLEDLLTAFAEEIEALEHTFNGLGLKNRSPVFDEANIEEANRHTISIPTEYGLNTAIDDFESCWPGLNDSIEARRLFELPIKAGWIDTSANRTDTKIRNWKKIIKHLQAVYPIVLHKSFWHEDGALYVGDGKRAHLPPKGFLTSTIAEILFRDIHRTWPIDQLIDKAARMGDIRPYTTDYEKLTYARIKKCCELINRSISEAKNMEIKLVICTKQGVQLDLSKFHILDRLSAI